MNVRTTFVLFGVLFAVLFVFALTQFLGVRPAGQREEWVFPELHEKGKEAKAGDISRVVMERGLPSHPETLEFVRGDQGWEMRQPYSLRVDSFQVDDVVNALFGARREKSDMSANLAEYGLDDPSMKITLARGDQETHLNLGKASSETATAVVYAVDPARPKDLMAIKKAGTLDGVYKPVSAFRAKDLLTASLFQTQEVSFQAPPADPVTLKKSGEGRWRFVKPSLGDAEVDGAPNPMAPPLSTKVGSVRDLLEKVGGIRVEDDNDFVAAGVDEAELGSKYGLAAGKPELLSVAVEKNAAPAKAEGESPKPVRQVLLVGKKVPPAPREEKADAKKDDAKKDDAKKDEPKKDEPPQPEYRYARLEGENAVVKIPLGKVEPLIQFARNPDKLRDRTLARVPADKVDAIDIKNAAGELRLRQTSPTPVMKQWKLFRDTPAGKEGQVADPSTIQLLVKDLSARGQVKTFPDPGAKEDYGFDKPAAVVSLWVEGLEPPKPDEKKEADKKDEKNDDKKPAPAGLPKLKSDKPSVKLTFGKRDRDKQLVTVRREADGETAVVTVSDTLLERVTAGPLAFLDRMVPQVPPDLEKVTTEVVLSRGEAPLRIERAVKDGVTTWKFKEPKDQENRPVSAGRLGDIFADLRSLTAQRLVAEGAITPADLDALYGLKNPAIEVRLVTEDKDKKKDELVYQFGKETEDKLGVYAKINKWDVVFVANKAVLEPLRAELRDPTLFSFSKSAVHKMKLTGWRDLTGSPYTLELERQAGGVWKPLVPPDFKLDTNQAEALLTTLSSLQAAKFLTPRDLPKLDQAKLDVQANALVIELTAEGEKEPLKLTLGAPDPEGKHYYATASNRPGEVFLLPKDKFEAVRAKPAYFNPK